MHGWHVNGDDTQGDNANGNMMHIREGLKIVCAALMAQRRLLLSELSSRACRHTIFSS